MVASTLYMNPVLVDCTDTQTYQSHSPHLRVRGQFIMDVLSCLHDSEDETRSALIDCGLQNIMLQRWYFEQDFLNILKRLSETCGPNALMRMGKGMPDILGFPTQVSSIEDAFHLLHRLLQQQYRGAVFDDFHLRRINRHATLVNCYHAYPCEIDMGVLSSLASRLNIVKSNVIHRSTCKKNGCRYCSIMISSAD